MMNRVLAALCAAAACAAQAQGPGFREPDRLVLKDGSTVRGLILRNSADSVLLQTKFGETDYPKSEIVRIVDAADLGIEFTDIFRKGALPSWRVIVNDLRLNDAIRELIEIPAVRVDVGAFRYVPYKSFRANRDIELNIYGDPENPAAIELGIYGWKQNSRKLRESLRAYLAGFLSTREEVAALYSIPFSGGNATAGRFTIEITPRDAPDAFGAWWISIFNPAAIESIRLSETEYDRLTKPAREVLGRGGRVKSSAWSSADLQNARRAGSDSEILARGFYRDRDGTFRIIEGS